MVQRVFTALLDKVYFDSQLRRNGQHTLDYTLVYVVMVPQPTNEPKLRMMLRHADDMNAATVQGPV